MGTHKVCKIELRFRCSYYHWSSLFYTCNRLSCIIAVGQDAATVSVTFQCLIIQGSVHLIHIHIRTNAVCEFFKQTNPCIQVSGSIVGMNHGNQTSIWCCNHIDLCMKFFQWLFQHDHREE